MRFSPCHQRVGKCAMRLRKSLEVCKSAEWGAYMDFAPSARCRRRMRRRYQKRRSTTRAVAAKEERDHLITENMPCFCFVSHLQLSRCVNVLKYCPRGALPAARWLSEHVSACGGWRGCGAACTSRGLACSRAARCHWRRSSGGAERRYTKPRAHTLLLPTSYTH